MTEKELHRLSRQDLLQLLLAQSKEVSRQKNTIEEMKKTLEEERSLTDRLKGKLDEKDEVIEHLKKRLDAKDETMNRLKEEAALRLAQVDAIRARLDEKDAALDAARARLDGVSPAPAVRTDTVPEPDPEERLRRIKERLAQGELSVDQFVEEQA